MTASTSGVATGRTGPGPGIWQLLRTPAFIGFLAYVFIIMTYRLPIGTLAMAAALVGLILQGQTLRAPAFFWLFAAWTGWAAIGSLVTPYPEVVSEMLIERAKLVLVVLVAVNTLRTGTQLRYFLLFVLVTYLLFPARSTLMNYVRGETLLGRAIGPFIYSNPNDLAAVTLLMLGPALALGVVGPHGRLTRWLGMGGAAILIIVIILTQSRGAFIALAAVTLPSGIALVRRRPRAVLALAALLGLALYLAPAAFWARMKGLRMATRVETIGEMDPEGSARQRFAVLQTAIRIIDDHPVLGIGLGSYGLANAQYSPELGELDTHNTYLNVLAETGAPGLVLFLAIVASVLREARDARRRAGRLLPVPAERVRWLQYGLVGYLTAGLFGSYSALTFPYVFLALLWSAAQQLRAQFAATSAAQPTGIPERQAPWR
jgi:O-antigen ligase